MGNDHLVETAEAAGVGRLNLTIGTVTGYYDCTG